MPSMKTMERDDVVRRRLEVRGIVQGVGFRPFVYRLARDLALDGWVRNDAAGVTIEVEGDVARIECSRARPARAGAAARPRRQCGPARMCARAERIGLRYP